MKINPKSQKGAITLIVLVTMLFLIAFLMSMYIRISNKAQTSAETTEEIAKKYNNIGEANDIYNSYFANSDVIPIYTVEQLKKIGSGEKIEVNGKIYTFTTNGYYTLMNDLDLGGYYDETVGTWVGTQWEPLPLSDSNGTQYKFTGTLDGLGHEIKGLYIEDTDSSTGSYKGLFSTTNVNTVIKNLGIVDSYVKGYNFVGSIAGKNDGTIEKCYSKCTTIATWKNVGGIIGSNSSNATIDKCYSQGEVKLLTGATTYGNIGGIAGTNEGIILNSYNYSTITNESSYSTGGIAGNNSAKGTINYCYNIGKIIGFKNDLGGIVGFNSGLVENSYNSANITNNISYCAGISGSSTGTIQDCYNTGDIESSQYTAGICGRNSGTIILCNNSGKITGNNITSGGIVASNTGTIEKSYNEGYVLGKNACVGGITGASSGIVKECFNKGIVYSRVYRIGGIVGENRSSVINCYNMGNIEGGGTDLGGIVGYNIYETGTPNVSNCYSKGTITGGKTKVGALIGSNGSTSTVLKCYALTDTHTSLIGTDSSTTTDVIFKLETEMKAIDGSFISLLNQGLDSSVWVEDLDSEFNEGYPILTWQSE